MGLAGSTKRTCFPAALCSTSQARNPPLQGRAVSAPPCFRPTWVSGCGQLLIRRHPACDLGARVKAELVQDAADVAVDGALRYEQPGSDLLVAQPFRDQPGDVSLTRPERSATFAVRSAT